MKFGSLFSGIGGFDFGLERAGMECVWQVECEMSCNKVLNHHWPDVPKYDDVREFHAGNIIRPELICGGFPCQDISVAGRRAGLAGKQSGLWYEFRRIIAEFAPGWVLIENVPGLLSSNGGRDMGTILGALGEFGYRWAYRVLDAQYFGVAQRRRRVFIVGSLDNRVHPAKVLFDAESLPGNPAPSRKAGASVARCLATGSNASRIDGDTENFVASTLTGGSASSPGVNPPGRRNEDDVNIVVSLDAHMGMGGVDDNAAQAGHLQPVPIQSAHQHGIAYQCHGSNVGEMGHLRAGNGNETGGVPFVQNGMAVRRLTPKECERLQGFPDGWTEGLSDSARYRAIGNAVAVPVAEWIGKSLYKRRFKKKK